MDDDRILLTKKGAAALRTKLEHMQRVERPEISKAIGVAREFGDLKENAEYHAAKDKQGLLEARIKELEISLTNAEIIDVENLPTPTKVRFGAQATLRNIDTKDKVTYTIVGELEADVAERRISYTTPMAKSMLGKSVGDIVEVVVDSSKSSFEVLLIEG